MLRLFKNNKVKKEKKNIIPRYITFLILSIILGGIFTALTSYAATIAATNISYSNSTSGLSATNAQAAIDEAYGLISLKPSQLIEGRNVRWGENGICTVFDVGENYANIGCKIIKSYSTYISSTSINGLWNAVKGICENAGYDGINSYSESKGYIQYYEYVNGEYECRNIDGSSVNCMTLGTYYNWYPSAISCHVWMWDSDWRVIQSDGYMIPYRIKKSSYW